MILQGTLLFAWDVGIRDAMFECDWKIVVDAILGSHSPLVNINNVIEGIQLKRQDFRSTQISHVKRQSKSSTHILAQIAKNINNYVVWIEENLYIIESILAQNVLFYQILNESCHLLFFIKKKKKKGKKILKESNNTKNTILQGRTMFIVENTHLTL